MSGVPHKARASGSNLLVHIVAKDAGVATVTPTLNLVSMKSGTVTTLVYHAEWVTWGEKQNVIAWMPLPAAIASSDEALNRP
jgi:hypothetical protein